MASGKGLSRTYHPAASARCDSLSRCDAIFTGEEMSCEEDLNFLTPAHLCKGVLQGAPSRPLHAGAACRRLQRYHSYSSLAGEGVAPSPGS